MIRLIGIDVDGTLLDSHGRMPEANRGAIHAAAGAGIHVARVAGAGSGNVITRLAFFADHDTPRR